MKIAIIATSPLQIMLSKHICDTYYPHAKVVCHIITQNKDARYSKNIELANKYGYAIVKHNSDCFLYSDLMKLLQLFKSLLSNNSYDLSIIGWYSSFLSHVIAALLVKNKGEIIYTDDGTATFQLEDSSFQKKAFSNPGWKVLWKILAFRKIRHRNYYSIFENIKSDKFNMINISWEIKSYANNDKSDGVFLIGTNPPMYRISFSPILTNEEYENFIIRWFSAVKKEYPNEMVFYTPHGRDNSEFVKLKCDEFGYKYIPSCISVEVDYVVNSYSPKVIMGLTSTALFTLKKIFSDALVLDIFPQGKSRKNIDCNAATLKGLESLGIKRYYL